MGWNSQRKAARKAANRQHKPASVGVTYVSVSHLNNDQRRILQKERDLALAEVRRKYQSALADIHKQYGQRVHAALAKLV